MKNIKIDKRSSLKEGSFIYTDLFINTSEKIALVLKSNKKAKKVKKAFSLLLQTFKENFNKKNFDVVEKIKKTITEMHWKLAAFFNTEKTKFEISLVLLVIKNDIIYAVQSGGLVIPVFSDTLDYIGSDLEQLCENNMSIPKLGIEEENIQYHVFSKKIEKTIQIAVLPAFSSEKIIPKVENTDDFSKNILNSDPKIVNPILVLSIKKYKNPQIRKRFHITTKMSATTLVIVVIIATFYVMLGKRWGQGVISSGKQLIDEKKELTLNIDNILTNETPLQFIKDWEWNADHTITLKPSFDSYNLFIVSDNKITAIRKNTYQISWTQQCENSVITLDVIRKNKLLVTDDKGMQYLINKTNGKIIWNKKGTFHLNNKGNKAPGIEIIDFIKDGRLEDNYCIYAVNNLLALLSLNEGNLITRKVFDNKIDFFSNYDYIEKCLYLTFGKKIIKINLMYS